MSEAIFNLLWLPPVLPFLAFVIIVLWAHRSKKLSAGLAIGAIGVAWVVSWLMAFTAFRTEGLAEDPFRIFRDWIPTGSTWHSLGFAMDPLGGVMLFMVPCVCLLIFVYSVGYMGLGKPLAEHAERGVPAEPGHVDPLTARFFAYIALFACGMLGFVLADNMILMLVFWEIMGLCSYLLIGFWFARKYDDPKKITPKEAGLKAFLTTRIGDTVMLAGILLLYIQVGSLNFSEIFQPATLETLATTTANVPLIGPVPWATVLAILIFFGAIGKSAQFPLHVWLPDAMEGPTPVSALIHAATMVSAGVYLVIRMYPLMSAVEHGPALMFISFIGAFTALFAATIALAQNDIKKVLAYSTISQLGFMFAALGIGAYIAATFHLLTHAFFKALLFLGSGSVIHGMEHGHHEIANEHGASATGHGDVHAAGGHSFDLQDMRNMGGLYRRMPKTGITFLLGGLALAGFPILTAGFWSKDEILADAFVHEHWIVFTVLVLAAALTAFYTARQITMTFLGKPRTPAAAHASESDSVFTWMVIPLAVLAFFAVTLGWIGIPTTFPVLGDFSSNPFHHIMGSMAEAYGFPAEELPFVLTPLLASIVVALGGLFVGWLVYRNYGADTAYADEPLRRPDPMQRALGPIYTVLQNKYYFDEFYDRAIVRPTKRLANWLYRFDDLLVIDPIVDGVGKLTKRTSDFSDQFDTHVIDAAVNGLGAVTGRFGSAARALQTGRVQNYLLLALVTISVLLGAFLLLPK
jgi:NADH-quinone oxidoreductase subunit L